MRRRPLGSSLSVSSDQRARGLPTDFAVADQDMIKRSLYRIKGAANDFTRYFNTLYHDIVIAN
ncbi:hypothetical protein E2562_006206 [Oryza meyeriana var. granulata]|uniref:Uncharacterized protein n=1 Tax=Oryza meyeriana var. granulata TaxID=110450 RepID=A0A6G1CNP5_9ORYZ|nr:hypothetical protein E2562_006206 [Oryza meyeriana var. granulata]